MCEHFEHFLTTLALVCTYASAMHGMTELFAAPTSEELEELIENADRQETRRLNESASTGTRSAGE